MSELVEVILILSEKVNAYMQYNNLEMATGHCFAGSHLKDFSAAGI